MVDPAPSDDLSGDSNAPPNKANENLIQDAKTRRHLRIAASVVVVCVVVALSYMLYLTVCAMLKDLAFITAPAVTFAATLVLALAALTIALLRSIFSDHGSGRNEAKDGPILTTPAIEALTAIREAIESVLSKAGKP